MKERIIFFAGLLAVLGMGCENSDLKFENMTQGITIAEDVVFTIKSIESTEGDIDAAKHSVSSFSGGMGVGGAHHFLGNNFPDCATVSVSGEGFPKEIVIDYGDGCSGRQGMGRTGTITIVMSDTFTLKGAVYTVTFENMTVGNKQIEKKSTITNEGLNEAGNWLISSITRMSTTRITSEDTIVALREFSQQKEWLSGFGTPETQDDQFMRSGGGTITINNELSFIRNITTPLLIDRSCRYPMSGIVEITRGEEAMIINFGDGVCDNIALVTKDDIEEEIELESGKFGKEFKRQHRHMKQKKGWW